MDKDGTLHWYALKVFYNRVVELDKKISAAGFQIYVPVRIEEKYKDGRLQYVKTPIIRSLMFVRCTEAFLMSLKRNNDNLFMFYSRTDAYAPAVIPDREMEIFMLVTRIAGTDVTYVGEDAPQYHVGEKVRVISGVYKGAEGYVKRIRRDRKLLVAVSGVAVVAISFIHPSFLEKVGPETAGTI